jgi:hypothetical protein
VTNEDEGPNYYHVRGNESFSDDELTWWKPWSDSGLRIGWVGTRLDGTKRGYYVELAEDGTATFHEWEGEP